MGGWCKRIEDPQAVRRNDWLDIVRRRRPGIDSIACDEFRRDGSRTKYRRLSLPALMNINEMFQYVEATAFSKGQGFPFFAARSRALLTSEPKSI